MLPHTSNGYSAQVRMRLHVSGQEVRVAQMGPDFLILAEPFATQETTATLHLTVDDVTEEIPIHMPHGIKAGNDWVETADVASEELVAA